MNSNNTRSNNILCLLACLGVLTLGACGGEPEPGQLPQGIGERCVVDTDCNAGLECEVEHGTGSCKPHGGGGRDPGRSDDSSSSKIDAGSASADAGAESGASDDPATPGAASECAVDADCGAGLECEVEHGVGLCQPHGGTASGTPNGSPSGAGIGQSCSQDTDCAAGLECEVEHGQGVCAAHGG